jgi:hypothetical protein
MILARDGDLRYVLEFVKALDTLPPTKRNIAIRYAKQVPFLLGLAIDRAWLLESRKPAPDWAEALASLAAIKQLAVERRFFELAAFALRAIAIVQDEYLNTPDEALSTLDAGIALASAQAYLLEDQKGVVLSRQKKYAEAIAIWKSILPSWPVGQGGLDRSPLFTCQRAGHAAGQIPDWQLAASFFDHGRKFAVALGSRLQELTFLADESFAQWKLGEKSAALTKLADVVQSLETLKLDNEDDFQLHRAWKSIEQVIKWCHMDSGVDLGVEVFEPPVGFCSQADANEKIREIPKGPIDFLWWFLAETEFRLVVGRQIFDFAARRISTSKYATFRCTMARLNLSWIFREQSFGSLLDAVAAFGMYFSAAQAQVAIGRAPSLPDLATESPESNACPLLEDAAVAALVNLAASNTELSAFFPEWSEAIGRQPEHAEMSIIITRIQTTLDADKQEMYRIYQDIGQGRMVGMIAALRMGTDTQERLSTMFLGQATLMSGLPSSTFKEEVSEAMGVIVKRTWEQRLSFAAEFPTPRITIPAIRAACKEETKGFKLAARILQKARFAAPSLRIPTETLQQLEALAR